VRPQFFATPERFRLWLKTNHANASELLVGYYKKGSGRPSITWPESVDEALCFGWIDGVRRSLGEEAYTIRFTPRRPRSIWSAINVARVAALEKLGRMQPAGLRAFAARTPERTGVYSFERKEAAKLPPDFATRLAANTRASEFFGAQAPWYQRAAIHWVISAKREETREKRLMVLISSSAKKQTIPPLTRTDGKKR
jgi:uncharacterized protein YdeI (YjbR/CyaY-like superfamily)